MPIQLFANPYITRDQAQAIVDILIHQCDLIERRYADNQNNYPELYDNEYMKGRTHGDTGAVLAGFQENSVIPGMTITKIQYGIMHWQPLLESETAVVQIYSSDASLNIKEIKAKCARWNTGESTKRFCVFQFRTSKKGHLTGVDLLDFDVNAKVIRRETIYKYRAITLKKTA